jgi:ABC-type branched-subunit amino acid transport system ATPase component
MSSGTHTDAPPALEADSITVRFGGHLAVAEASITVMPGMITGLIGPNGAGKTTTFNALCGLQPVSGGRVRLGGTDVTKLSTHQRARRGLARTFQRLETFSLMTVRENILAGAEFRTRNQRRGSSASEIADELIERLHLGDVAHTRADALPTGRARMVDVARALANDPTVLLLDEPSSGLDEVETDAFAEMLIRLCDDGLGILMVEHDMELVMNACAQLFVLDFGSMIASGTPDEIQQNAAVRSAYLGDATPTTGASGAPAAIDLRSVEEEPHSSPSTSSALAFASESESLATQHRFAATSVDAADRPVLTVSGVSAGYGEFDVIADVDLSVHPGEVLALLGPNGAGKTTLLKVISGLINPSHGSVELCGIPVGGADADALARAGLAMVPEGRGVFANLTVAENLWVASATGTERGVLEERAYARFPRLAERRKQLAGTMSGGEQQMLAMARALSSDPAMLLLDELSMGLAPRIVAELYEQVGALAESGLSILVVEQFAHEVLGVATRAAVMLHGTIAATGAPEVIAGQLASAYLSGSLTVGEDPSLTTHSGVS